MRVGLICAPLCLLIAACSAPRIGGAPAVESVAASHQACVLRCNSSSRRLGCLRPSSTWALREALRRRPPTSEADAISRRCCLGGARRKSVALAAGASAASLAYGAAYWDYFSAPFEFNDEGWFDEDAYEGGADKIGHVVSTFAGTSIASALNRSFGFSRQEAALRGALTGFLYMTVLELADGTSPQYGFSYGDVICNGVGALCGYLHETNPWIHSTFDLRFEWLPDENPVSGGKQDITTDYDRITYVLAANVGSLVRRDPSAWDLLDLQVGYRVRGYDEGTTGERWILLGVGLNLANLLRRVGFRYAAFFDYYQAPFISLRLGIEVGSGDVDLLYGI